MADVSPADISIVVGWECEAVIASHFPCCSHLLTTQHGQNNTMFHLPDDIGFLLSAPLAGLVVPCSGRKSTFLPLWTRPKRSLSELKIFKATITIERRTTRAAKQVLASFTGWDSSPTFRPSSKVLQTRHKKAGPRSGALQMTD